MDTDAEFRIKSPSPGVTAKFRGSNDNDLELVVKGDGEVSLELYWDDDPNSNGKAVGNIKVAGETWKQTSHKDKKDSLTKTIKVGNSSNTGASRKNITKSFPITYRELNSRNNPMNVSSNGKVIRLKDGSGSDTNAKMTIIDVKGGTAKFSQDGKSLICNGMVDVTIDFDVDDDPDNAGLALRQFSPLVIKYGAYTRRGGRGEIENVKLDATQLVPSKPEEVRLVPEQGTSKVFGRGKKGTESQDPGQIIFADIIGSLNDNDDMQIRCDKGIFTPSNKTTKKGTGRQGTVKRNTWDLTFRVDASEESVEEITNIGEGFGKYDVRNQELSRSVTVGPPVGRTVTRAPVIVNPTLATYRTGSLGPFLSPFFPLGTKESGSNLQGRTWEMIWENVEFPIAGKYKIEVEADDILEVFIGENLSDSFGSEGYKSVAQTKVFKGVEVYEHRVTNPGKRDIKLILQNASIPGTSFRGNPTCASCRITVEENIELADQRSWLINPVGISAVLLAPPCERVVGGIGTVTKVIVEEPGNSNPPSGGGDPGVPGQVVLTKITPQKPGIGYTPGDTVVFLVLPPIFQSPLDHLERLLELDSELSQPITTYPPIISTTTTGTGLITTIETELRVDTPEVDPETVIQITDLAGLKQTGYIEGRPYYGEVFYKDGVPFAGRYETAGRLIQVYATLQESIDAEVTTRPSAIQRSGTDINSNNPRLNIPGTPDNLV